MFKLVAIDLDGTLLNDENTIPELTVRCLQKASEKGVVITLATGRMFASAKKIAQHLGLNVPIITYQGALIKNALDDKIWTETPVPVESTKRIYQFCKEHKVHIQLYVDDVLYVPEMNEKAATYAALSHVSVVVPPDFEELIERPSYKILMIDEPERLDIMATTLKEILGSEIHVTKSKPHFLEITHAKATKGVAIEWMANHFKIPVSETIAIGDAWNDQEMIERAGLGVAMGNAPSSLKKIADEVARTNNEEGVRYILEKYV